VVRGRNLRPVRRNPPRHHLPSARVTKTNATYGNNSQGPRVLIFNQQGRTEAADFLDYIYAATKREGGRPAFDRAIFCTNVTYEKTGYKRDFVNHQYDPNDIEKMVTQRRFAERWASLDPGAEIQVVGTIEQAINSARDLGASHGQDKVDAFITGSLHLVGGALAILEKADAL
jgi:folylpolyglutamate synthase/dihydropteroate synthase